MGDLRREGTQVGFAGHNAIEPPSTLGNELVNLTGEIEQGFSREGAVQDAQSIINEAEVAIDAQQKRTLATASGAIERQVLAEQQGKAKGGLIKLRTQSKLNELRLDNKRFINEINLTTANSLAKFQSGVGGGGGQTDLEKKLDKARSMHVGDPNLSVDEHLLNLLDVEALELEAQRAEANKKIGIGAVFQLTSDTRKLQASSLSEFNVNYPELLEQGLTTDQIKQDISIRKSQIFAQGKLEWEQTKGGQMPAELQDKFKKDIENNWAYTEDFVSRGDRNKILQDKQTFAILDAGSDMSKIFVGADSFKAIYGEEEGKWFPEYKKFIQYAAKGRDIGFKTNPEWIPLFDKFMRDGTMEKIMTASFGKTIGSTFNRNEFSQEEQDAVDMIRNNGLPAFLQDRNLDNKTHEAALNALGLSGTEVYDLSVLAQDNVRRNVQRFPESSRTFKRLWVPQWQDAVNRLATELPDNIEISQGATGFMRFKVEGMDFPVNAPEFIELAKKGIGSLIGFRKPTVKIPKTALDINPDLIRALEDMHRLHSYVRDPNGWRTSITEGGLTDITGEAISAMANLRAQKEPEQEPEKNEVEKAVEKVRAEAVPKDEILSNITELLKLRPDATGQEILDALEASTNG